MRQVACPVALHPDGALRQIAVFKHPQAGMQLVKGGIKPGEPQMAAASRELYEESGLETRATLLIGSASDIHPDEVWHFTLCRVVPPIREQWQHYCADDGGHLFHFLWMALDTPAQSGFDPRYLRALDWLRANL